MKMTTTVQATQQKPKLSFWQIWNISFGFLGVQLALPYKMPTPVEYFPT